MSSPRFVHEPAGDVHICAACAPIFDRIQRAPEVVVVVRRYDSIVGARGEGTGTRTGNQNGPPADVERVVGLGRLRRHPRGNAESLYVGRPPAPKIDIHVPPPPPHTP